MTNMTLTGEQLAAITREMVRIKSRHYGRGATEGKSYQCDELVISVLKGGLIPAERDLLDHGDMRLVRELRMRFQENHQPDFAGAVERITGRRVLGYESQVLFDPDYTVEIFVLGDGPPAAIAGHAE